MPPEVRLRELSAQLLRAHNPEVIQMVAEQLMSAIDAYAASVQSDFPAVESPALPKDLAA